MPLGEPLHAYDDLPSTNDAAARLAEQGAPEGTLVIARTQSAGRGRMGRAWSSPAGGLWMSLVLRPHAPGRDVRPLASEALPALTLVLATAVAEVVESATGIDTTVRWPNDVYVGDRKIAGLLAEARWSGSRLDYACLGLGLNVAFPASQLPSEVHARATTLQDLGATLMPEDLLPPLLGHLDGTYHAFLEHGFEPIRPRVEARCATLDRQVRIRREGDYIVEGRAAAIALNGALRLDTSEGPLEVWTCEEARVL